jgi:hypothetical protein
VSDKFTSRRVDLFVVAYQFPRPSVGRGYVVFVVPTAKVKTAIIAVVTKLNSSNATVSDSSLFFVCHWSPLLKWNSSRVYTVFGVRLEQPSIRSQLCGRLADAVVGASRAEGRSRPASRIRRLGSGTKRKCAGETGERKARREFRREEAGSLADFYVVAEATTHKEFQTRVKTRILGKLKGSGTADLLASFSLSNSN